MSIYLKARNRRTDCPQPHQHRLPPLQAVDLFNFRHLDLGHHWHSVTHRVAGGAQLHALPCVPTLDDDRVAHDEMVHAVAPVYSVTNHVGTNSLCRVLHHHRHFSHHLARAARAQREQNQQQTTNHPAKAAAVGIGLCPRFSLRFRGRQRWRYVLKVYHLVLMP